MRVAAQTHIDFIVHRSFSIVKLLSFETFRTIEIRVRGQNSECVRRVPTAARDDTGA